MTVHLALTNFPALQAGAMIFLAGATPIVVGDELDLALGEVAETRMTVTGRSGNILVLVAEGRAEPWTMELTEHPLSDNPVLIVSPPL